MLEKCVVLCTLTTTDDTTDRIPAKALSMLKDELILLRNGFVKSIGNLIDIIDSAKTGGVASSALHGVDIGTTTEAAVFERGTSTSDEVLE